MENNESQNTEMKNTESQNSKMNTTIVDRILPFIVLIITIVVIIFGCKASERERIIKYNDKLEELCKWIDGYEIVNVDLDYEFNHPLTFTWTLTRLNNGIEETINVEDDAFKSLKETCPIDSYVRVSPDNKYHIVEDDNKLVIYRPSDDYYNTVSKSKYSSK